LFVCFLCVSRTFGADRRLEINNMSEGDGGRQRHGSCLCGGVTFAVDLPFDRFVHCHCSRCRKATGTAHASNAAVKATAFRWLQGEDLVVRYDLPTARSFATSFCRICGSPLPHLTRSGREAIIPAGAFDDELGVKPERHRHWASRADWYAHGTELPKED
jgi:hypothetical protein